MVRNHIVDNYCIHLTFTCVRLDPSVYGVNLSRKKFIRENHPAKIPLEKSVHWYAETAHNHYTVKMFPKQRLINNIFQDP
jgi:hypothetical protein